MSADDILQQLRYILGSLEDQYTCSDREKCEQVVADLKAILEKAR
jgi:hypothetical protein